MLEIGNKEKYLQIFNYLLEFSKLRSNPVRDINNADSAYPERIWFTDIPEHDLCNCITHSGFNQENECWVKINKPKEPEAPLFPKLTPLLDTWVAKDSLTNEHERPVLLESIESSGIITFLSEIEGIENEFENYLNDQWEKDLTLYTAAYKEFEITLSKYEGINKIYKQLFTIYNKAQQFGEEYELVLGVGLLKFKENEDSPSISRHILTSKAEISFEFSDRDSYIQVSASIDNEIQVETDAIIDLQEQFESINIIEAERKVIEFLKEKEIQDNPFDPQIKDSLQIFADRLRPDGQFKDEMEQPKEIPTKPLIYFAPAILLRKRNTRSFTALYEKIIENITNEEDDIDIASINDLIKTTGGNEIVLNGELSEAEVNNFDIDTIYFPKKYNDEQIEIVQKSQRNNKVLVQGPPGTGKSHTIANLICHLLANGKRILVTAYTKRALEVLKNQLPEDFQSLTVNLLSGDSSSMQDLQASVNAINAELARANLHADRDVIVQLEEDLVKNRSDKAYAKNEWLKVKEKSIRSQFLNRKYEGTLISIAEQIGKEREEFSWFEDDFSDVSNTTIISDIQEMDRLLRHYEAIDCSGYNTIIPAVSKLLSLEDLREFRKIANNLTRLTEDYPNYNKIETRDHNELITILNQLHTTLASIDNSTLPFKSELITETKGGSLKWKDKLNETNKILASLNDDKLRNHDVNVEIAYPSNKSLKQLKYDALLLLKALKDGKKLSGLLSVFNIPFTAKDIKERKYFVDEVKVNGSPCNSIEAFNLVLEDLEIKQCFELLEKIWNIAVNNSIGLYYDKAFYYKQLKSEVEGLIEIVQVFNTQLAQAEQISSVKVHSLTATDLKSLIIDAEISFLTKEKLDYDDKVEEINKYLLESNIHPISIRVREIYSLLDAYTYEKVFSEIENLHIEKNSYHNYLKLIKRLSGDVPVLVNQIMSHEFNNENLNSLEAAIHFKHASNEIGRLLHEDYEEKQLTILADLELQEEKLISKLASKKAWLKVLEGLENNRSLRQHLEAWVQAVKKIGITGKGKRALKFRKEAQVQMEQCKDSVPCWIMPLYKVAETINPEQGMYDYVIIDEASQLGPDAIFLLYISKNIIIVGDDKQTSPEYVGVDGNVMTPHIKRHLQDIPFSNFYGTEFSFFDHAKRFCEGMTVLREHFRCMPEIIEFCNKHFYAPDGKGLYPLKQYSENRLESLKTIFCQNGYTDGQSQNIINRNEADCLVDKVSDLVTDDRYIGKTFGIIVLQGNKQAALIENLLLKKIGETEFHRRKIVCGNSASFQGDERDIVFLSLITAHNHKRSALTKPEDERRYNVAVSRAKEQIWLFHSILLDDLNTNDLRHKLLDHFLNYKHKAIPLQRPYTRTFGSQPEPFDSWFEVDVFNDIVSNGFSVIPQYEVAKGKYIIDLVALLPNGVKIAIECDGDKFHGPEQFHNDLMRQKVLERCGWQFFRIRGFEYYVDRKKSLAPLWNILNANKQSEEESIVVTRFSSSNFVDADLNNSISDNDESSNQIQKTPSDPEIDTKGQMGLFEDWSNNSIERKPTSKSTDSDQDGSFTSGSFNDYLIFTTVGNVYKIQNKHHKNRQQLIDEIEFEPGEQYIYVTSTNKYNGFLIVGFENGKVGKITFESYKTEFNRKKLKNGFSTESRLVFIGHIEEDTDLVAISNINKVVLFNTGMINPVESKTTKGVQVMKSKDQSKMIKIKKLNHVKFSDPGYYRKDGGLNVVGYYLKPDDIF